MGKIKFHHFWPSWKNLGKFREYPPWKNPSHAHAAKKSVCYDAAKIIEPKLDNTQCGFCRGRSTTEEISTLQQIFQEILGTCQSLIHTFCRPRESIWPGSPWKAWGDVVGVRCWRVSIAGRQVTVFLFRRLCPCRRSLLTVIQCWCWAPKMVCAVTTPLHNLQYIRVLHTTARGSNSTYEVISPGHKTNFANNEEITRLRKMCWFGRM